MARPEPVASGSSGSNPRMTPVRGRGIGKHLHLRRGFSRGGGGWEERSAFEVQRCSAATARQRRSAPGLLSVTAVALAKAGLMETQCPCRSSDKDTSGRPGLLIWRAGGFPPRVDAQPARTFRHDTSAWLLSSGTVLPPCTDGPCTLPQVMGAGGGTLQEQTGFVKGKMHIARKRMAGSSPAMTRVGRGRKRMDGVKPRHDEAGREGRGKGWPDHVRP